MASDAMSELLHGHLEAIRSLCREYGVSRLELFGSFARGDFEAGRSDVDLVIESGLRNPYLIRSIEQDRRLLYAA
jgi:predicted nucleotidyltransferase